MVPVDGTPLKTDPLSVPTLDVAGPFPFSEAVGPATDDDTLDSARESRDEPESKKVFPGAPEEPAWVDCASEVGRELKNVPSFSGTEDNGRAVATLDVSESRKVCLGSVAVEGGREVVPLEVLSLKNVCDASEFGSRPAGMLWGCCGTVDEEDWTGGAGVLKACS
jgi:hypothetical protein